MAGVARALMFSLREETHPGAEDGGVLASSCGGFAARPFAGIESWSRPFALLFAALFLCHGQAAVAQTTIFLTGEQLYSFCAASDDYGRGVCSGYIAGMVDDLQVNAAICVPKDTDLSTLRDAVVRYQRENPAERQYIAVSTVEIALGEAFPCPQSDGVPGEK